MNFYIKCENKTDVSYHNIRQTTPHNKGVTRWLEWDIVIEVSRCNQSIKYHIIPNASKYNRSITI